MTVWIVYSKREELRGVVFAIFDSEKKAQDFAVRGHYYYVGYEVE